MATPHFRKIAEVVRGFSNHHRVHILHILDRQPELSLEEMAEKIKTDYRNLSEHVRKMAIAKLLIKRYEGHRVRHKLTPLGRCVLQFCRTLE